MRHISVATVLALCLGICTTVFGLDNVKLIGGKTASGEITGTTSQEVTIKSHGGTKTVPVNQIVSVSLDDSPSPLTLARMAANNGRYEDALKAMEKIKPEEVKRDLVKQDIDFYKAYCTAQLALAGSGEVKTAGQMLNSFARANPNSYHWLKANEVLGDLLVASKKFSTAATFYDKLAKTPWPDYQMKAQVAIGRAQLAEGKPNEALKAFDSVLASQDTSVAAEAQKLYARLGKALCLAQQNKSDEAVKLIDEIIMSADPEQKQLLARAYNAKGTALRKAGKPNDALLAFLHVDVLYFSSPEDHAEALANLAELWGEVHKPQRAMQAKQTLKQRYKNSRWATQ
ncbi:MAG: tetratricopeptide repeat protein [Pirellulales bacterium]|nr:tetratricopeptide repeat protein [Pirellulales bacterium]